MADRVRVKIDVAPVSKKKRTVYSPNGNELTPMEPQRKKTGGREKGTPNKVTVILKDGIMAAMDQVGYDTKGKEGVVGFLKRMAIRKPEQFMRLVEKLLPYQLTGKDGGPMQLVHQTKEELVARMKERGLPVPQSLMDAPSPSQSVN